MNTKFLSLLFAVALPLSAQAGGFKGGVEFTEAEKAEHVRVLPTILDTAASCIQEDFARHGAFHKKYGISAFYGDRSAFSKLSTIEKKAYMKKIGVDPALLSQMKGTSCVGLTRKCLGKGFEVAGQAAVWKRISDFTIANGVDGSAMQDGLQKLGWKVLYWNPNTTLNTRWDAEEKAKNPTNSDKFWGYHQDNWVAANKRRKYYYNRVDDIRELVNFGTEMPSAIRKIPFFVGTAHMGYHVFPGTFGQIIEAHSTRKITDARTMETSEFNPLGGGGPTEGEYRSGLITVPPGYL